MLTLDDISKKNWIYNIRSKREVGIVVFNHLKNHFDVKKKNTSKWIVHLNISTSLLKLYDNHSIIHLSSTLIKS